MVLRSKNICSLCLLLLGLLVGCTKTERAATDASKITTTESGLQYQILREGSGPKAEKGDEVLIYETTSYRDGTVLYSNENSQNPIKVKIGANQVIIGVDEGLQGMKAGEIRELRVPYYLAKRTVYPDHISPDSGLVIKMIVDEIIKD